jgi:hypothetical protein
MSRKFQIPLKALAVYEAAKGLLVLLVGSGMVRLKGRISYSFST